MSHSMPDDTSLIIINQPSVLIALSISSKTLATCRDSFKKDHIYEKKMYHHKLFNIVNVLTKYKPEDYDKDLLKNYEQLMLLTLLEEDLYNVKLRFIKTEEDKIYYNKLIDERQKFIDTISKK